MTGVGNDPGMGDVLADEWLDALGALGAGSPTSDGSGAQQAAASPSQADGLQAAASVIAGGAEAASVPIAGEAGDEWAMLVGELAAGGNRSDPGGSDCDSAPDGGHAEGMLAIVPAADPGYYGEVGPGGPAGLRILAHRAQTVPEEDVDEEVMSVARHYLVDKRNVGQLSNDATMLGADRKLVRRLRLGCAAACDKLERMSRRHLEEQVVARSRTGEIELLCYIDCWTYDCVDFSLRSRAVMATSASDMAPPAAEGQLAPHDAQHAPQEPLAPSCRVDESVGVTKVLNSETCFYMVLRVRGAITVVSGAALTRLVGMDRTTGECIRAVLRAQQNETGHLSGFRRRIRLTTTDGATTNFKAERSIVRDSEGWQSIHLDCIVHTTSGIHTKVFGLVREEVSGMLAVSLSLSHSNQMTLFRLAFQRVLRRMLVLDSSDLGSDAIAYREMVLDLFFGRDIEVAEHRTALGRLLGGDWREKGRVVYRPSPGETRADALRNLEQLLAPYLVGHAPFAFPRHRWTGMEKSLRDIGFLACAHDLLGATYEEFIAVHHGGAALVEQAAADAPGHAGADVGSRAPATEEGGSAWAKENRAHRGKALAWCRSPTDSICVLMRMVLSPMMKYLHRHLAAAGGQWETAEVAKLLGEARASGSVRSALGRREFPMLLCARGDLDTETMRAIADLQDTQHYKVFPESGLTVQTQHLAFRLWSKEGAAFYQLVLTKNRSFPRKLFRLLLEPPPIQEIIGSCASSRDEYTQSFLDTFGDDLSGEAAMSELVALAIAARSSIARIESLNATVRRHLVASCVQAKRPDMPTVSAEYMLGRIRRRELQLKAPSGSRVHLRKVIKKDGCGKLPALRDRGRRGGGGPWRAFVSKRCRGIRRAAFAELSSEYNALSKEELASLDQEGLCGTIAHRLGGAAFGLRDRQASRLAQRLASRERAAALSRALTAVFEQTTALAMSSTSFESKLRKLRADIRIHRKLRREIADADAEAVAAFRALPGVVARDRFVTAAPGLARDAVSLTGDPAVGVESSLLWCMPLGMMVPRLLATHGVGRTSPLMLSLLEEWEEHHQSVLHHQQPRIIEDHALAEDATTCRSAGTCICANRKEILRLKTWFLSSMRKALEPVGRKASLSDGLIVVRFWAERETFLEGHNLECQATIETDRFLHIAMMYWQPVRPTLRVMTEGGSSHRGQASHITLTASDTYCTLFELLAEVVTYQADSWNMEFFEIADSPRPIHKLDPRSVEISRIPGVAGRKLEITGPRAHRRARAAQDVDAQWLSHIDALGDGASEASSCEWSGSGASVHSSQYESVPMASSQSERFDSDVSMRGDIELDMPDVGRAFVDAGSGEGSLPDINVDEGGADEDSSSSASSTCSNAPVQDVSGVAEPSRHEMVGPAPSSPATASDPNAHVGEQVVVAGARNIDRGRAGKSDIEVSVRGGFIRHYSAYSSMVAHCDNPLHGNRCRFTRSTKPSDRSSRAGQGRPLGLLLSWLQVGADENIRTAAEHLHVSQPDFATRSSCRAELGSLVSADVVQAMLACERPQRPGEGEEPTTIP